MEIYASKEVLEGISDMVKLLRGVYQHSDTTEAQKALIMQGLLLINEDAEWYEIMAKRSYS